MARFERQENLLRLCIMMQGTAEGVSLADIGTEFGVSRRTAERMRDAVIRVFPQVDEVILEGRQKRWRMPASTLGRMDDPTLDDMAALNRGAEIARARGDDVTADKLEILLYKLRADIDRKKQTKMEPDLAALLEADCVALRPGPREKLDKDTLEIIRDAVLSSTLLKVSHLKRATKELKHDIELGPLGLLLGNGRQYLVAWHKHSNQVKHYALSGIKAIKATNEYFEKPENFDLKDFLAQGFGLYHDDMHDVEWKFSPIVADLAENYQFHPHQTSIRNDDDSLTVKFKSSGLREMSWHLFQWGTLVEVISPPELVDEYSRQIADIKSNLETSSND